MADSRTAWSKFPTPGNYPASAPPQVVDRRVVRLGAVLPVVVGFRAVAGSQAVAVFDSCQPQSHFATGESFMGSRDATSFMCIANRPACLNNSELRTGVGSYDGNQLVSVNRRTRNRQIPTQRFR